MFLDTKQLGALIMIVIFKECKQYGNEKNWNFRIDVGSISFELTGIYAFQIIGKKDTKRPKKTSLALKQMQQLFKITFVLDPS